MKKIVISLGGSVIIPNEINKKFILGFKDAVKNARNCKFAVVCGAGALKKMIFEAKQITQREKDLIGIDATRLNALVVGNLFYNEYKVPETVNEIIRMLKTKDVVVSGGIAPGYTTDYVACMIAKKMHADFLINISNVKGIYTKDPKKYKDAKLISKMSFIELNRMFGNIKRMPGQKVIFDDKAARCVSSKKIKTYFIGSDVKNLKNLLDGKKFIGTEVC